MRRWLLAVVGLMQAGCYAWLTPPLEAQMGFGPAWDARSRSVRPVPSYHASLPISGWHRRTPHMGSTWDVQAGYLLQPLPGEHLVHGPLLGVGWLVPIEAGALERGLGADRGSGRSGIPMYINHDTVFRRYGVHGQVRGLFGDGVGMEAAVQLSLEWARYVRGERYSEYRSLMYTGTFWSGYQATGLFLEASAGVQDGRARWGVTAGLTFRLPASVGFGVPDTTRLRELDWVKALNGQR
jgi:hypothetical protein